MIGEDRESKDRRCRHGQASADGRPNDVERVHHD